MVTCKQSKHEIVDASTHTIFLKANQYGKVRPDEKSRDKETETRI